MYELNAVQQFAVWAIMAAIGAGVAYLLNAYIKPAVVAVVREF